MAHIYVAVAQGGVLVGDFARVTDIELAGNVEALKERIKVVRSADLAGVQPWHMTVFGPFGAKPLLTEVASLVKGEPRDPAATLSTLVDGKERVYFIVRITAPIPASAAAGASAIASVGLPHGPCSAARLNTVTSPLALPLRFFSQVFPAASHQRRSLRLTWQRWRGRWRGGWRGRWQRWKRVSWRPCGQAHLLPAPNR